MVSIVGDMIALSCIFCRYYAYIQRFLMYKDVGIVVVVTAVKNEPLGDPIAHISKIVEI